MIKKAAVVGFMYLIGKNLPYIWIRVTEYWHPFTGVQRQKKSEIF